MNRLHDINGMLIVGADRHFGVHWPTPIPFPCMFWELVFMHPFWMGGNQQPTVQLNGGHNSVVDTHMSVLLWGHIPFAPDPLNMLFPLDFLFGNHITPLARGKVHICGTPAAITLFPANWSINMDCWTGANIPPSVIYQPGTVVTTADFSDYFAAGVRLAINIAMEYFLGRAKRARAGAATPTGIRGWSNSRRALQYMRRTGPAGQRARSTFRNALTRGLRDRLVPPRNLRGAAGFIGKKVFGSPGFVADGLYHGNLPDTSPGTILKRQFPPLRAVEGIQQSSGQQDMWPFG
jgi:hypothetical protein